MDNILFNKSDRLVTSTYADIYYDDLFCETEAPYDPNTSNVIKERPHAQWQSPSDLIIDKVDLKPPLTSKITRGKTHEGIIAIGNEVLLKERDKFMQKINDLVENNNAAWKRILDHESASIITKIQQIYDEILASKNNIFAHEITKFYSESLQELENFVMCELENMKISTSAHTLTNMNIQIKHKLNKEKRILENVLQKRYITEVEKIKKYYKLLLQNELKESNKHINKALFEKDEALKAFCKEAEADNITSTMYVMCSERKKCKIRKFLINNIHSSEVQEKLNKIKQRQETLENLEKEKSHVREINKNWEEKIKKILRLFLKFISFGLKLLPEQTAFLFDFQKMVVLQLNEIQRAPNNAPLLLIENEDLQNDFKFEQADEKDVNCKRDPFVITGDLTESTPIRYGSRETLPSDVELPIIRIQRQYVYAKGTQFSQIKMYLDSKTCKCLENLQKSESKMSLEKIDSVESADDSVKSESSSELFLVDEINRLKDSPVKRCKDWSKAISFPDLDSYLDFTDEKFELVKTILGDQETEIGTVTGVLNPKEIATAELLFAATKEKYHTIATQYSSQESVNVSDLTCPCIDNLTPNINDVNYLKESASESLHKILAKRKQSLQRLMQTHTNLLKMFTDECFDFQF